PSPLYGSVQINVNSAGTVLSWVNVATGVVVSSWSLPMVVNGIGLGKGNPTDDGRYIALGNNSAPDVNGHYTTTVFAVDMNLGIVGSPWPIPDCDLYPLDHCQVGSFSLSPDANYLVVKYAAEDGGTPENNECNRVF